MRTIKEKKETIQLYLNHFNDQQITLLYDILSFANNTRNKGALMNICYDNNTRNIDTAIPNNYANEVRNLQLNTFYLCMNYQNSSGKINNIAELFVEKLLNDLEVK